jgi:hypothetical protein
MLNIIDPIANKRKPSHCGGENIGVKNHHAADNNKSANQINFIYSQLLIL